MTGLITRITNLCRSTIPVQYHHRLNNQFEADLLTIISRHSKPKLYQLFVKMEYLLLRHSQNIPVRECIGIINKKWNEQYTRISTADDIIRPVLCQVMRGQPFTLKIAQDTISTAINTKMLEQWFNQGWLERNGRRWVVK